MMTDAGTAPESNGAGPRSPSAALGPVAAEELEVVGPEDGRRRERLRPLDHPELPELLGEVDHLRARRADPQPELHVERVVEALVEEPDPLVQRRPPERRLLHDVVGEV